MNDQTLSKIICDTRQISPIVGTMTGTCCICGQYTKTGHKFDDTGTFTTFQYILGGDCVCPYCWEMKRNRSHDYRMTMWSVDSTNGYRDFKFDGARNALQNPPEPPFAIYFTRTWKKQGWTRLVTRLNYSRDRFIAGFDYDIIDVDAATRDQYFALIDKYLKLGLSKTELHTSKVKPKTFERIGMDQNILDTIQQCKDDPLWDLCVFVTPAPRRDTK